MSTRYYTLDHWRGLACLMVVVSHSVGPAAWRGTIGVFPPLGRMGVGIFFAISGYCIAAAVDSSRKKEHSFGHFMFRRFRRIFPPYWAALLLLLCLHLAQFGLPEAWPSLWMTMGNLTLTESWRYLVVGPHESQMFLTQAWTLCHEEQFYLTCGLLLLLPQRAFLSIVMGLCGLTAGVIVADRLGLVDLTGVVFAGTWLSFAPGVFVFHALHSKARWEVWASRAGILLAVIGGCVIWNESVGIASGCFFSAVMLALHRFDKKIAGMQALSWLYRCGVASYSLYLTHTLVCDPTQHWLREHGLDSPAERMLLVAPICVAGSLLLAWPFHVFIERRFMPAPKVVGPQADDGEQERQAKIVSVQAAAS
jgi:peptidoglycan/LPS O-acetylase OafA/YrhL